MAGVLALWAVRLVIKIFLSQLHLARDAAERVTMVTAYLSLQESGKLDSDKDREIILKALFRPAVDGVVKDDAMPPSVVEVLTRKP